MGFLDLIFPKKCVQCGKDGGYVCKQCEVGMWEEEQICPSCCRNSRYGLRHKYCRHNHLEGLICLWSYDGIVKRIIGEAKYKFHYDVMEQLLGDVEKRREERPEFTYLRRFLAERPTIIPVPLYGKRMKERGFNQAEVVGNWLGKKLGLDVDTDLLIRVKDTGRQVGRTRRERLEAIHGAFEVRSNGGGRPPGFVVVVDDVWTTGTTLNEASSVLRKCGVKRIWGLVMAR